MFGTKPDLLHNLRQIEKTQKTKIKPTQFDLITFSCKSAVRSMNKYSVNGFII